MKIIFAFEFEFASETEAALPFASASFGSVKRFASEMVAAPGVAIPAASVQVRLVSELAVQVLLVSA